MTWFLVGMCVLAAWVMLRVLGGEREAQLRAMKARIEHESEARE